MVACVQPKARRRSRIHWPTGVRSRLAALLAVGRLEPEVVLIFLPEDGIDEAKPIRGEAWRPRAADNDAGVGIKNLNSCARCQVNFSAFVVLGFGMAISVAPLTTVVMSSAGRDRAGTASGINNAVARVASVLAIAILGIVMVRMFGSDLRRNLRGQMLPPGIFHYIQSNAIKLAGLDLPAGLAADTIVAIHAAISHAFVFAFRIEMFICAGLSLASGAVAWRMVPARVEWIALEH